MDPDSPVVRLCAQGMEAESRGRVDDARACFERAWEARTDDYEGCIAAHYVARHQPDDEATYRWNLLALTLADRSERDADVTGFYPSLHLNLASSYQALGDRTAARAHLEAAGALIEVLPDTPYKEFVRSGIGNVRARLAG
jgi:tetratricopeptide (TPR) repeat protein